MNCNHAAGTSGTYAAKKSQSSAVCVVATVAQLQLSQGCCCFMPGADSVCLQTGRSQGLCCVIAGVDSLCLQLGNSQGFCCVLELTPCACKWLQEQQACLNHSCMAHLERHCSPCPWNTTCLLCHNKCSHLLGHTHNPMPICSILHITNDSGTLNFLLTHFTIKVQEYKFSAGVGICHIETGEQEVESLASVVVCSSNSRVKPRAQAQPTMEAPAGETLPREFSPSGVASGADCDIAALQAPSLCL